VTEVRRTVTGFVALAGATAAAQLIGFFVLAVIARRLDPAGVGSFAFAISLMGYFAIPANFGVIALATRDVAAAPERAREVLGEVLVLQTLLSLLMYGLLVALAPVLAADEDSRRLIPVVGLTFLIEGLAIAWVLYARHRFVFAAFARLVGALVYAGLVLWLVDEGDDPFVLGPIHLAGVAATSVLTCVVALRVAGRPPLTAGWRRLVARFRTGVPLGVAAVMVLVYYTLDTLMLGWMKDTETVGQYAVAYRIPYAILAFAVLWGQVLFPHASALAAQERRRELREQLGWFASLSLAASLPLLAGAILVGEELMPELFGDAYAPAGTPFVLLMASAAIVFFSVNYGTVATALGDERRYAWIVTGGAVTNVVANLIVIPPYGMEGAACATIGAEAVVLVLLVLRLRQLLGAVPLELWRIARTTVATVLMVAAVLVLPGGIGALAAAAVGAAVFVGAGLALGVVRPSELAALARRGEQAPVVP
jgi:O-antigen/teichoic acid export membrane protein